MPDYIEVHEINGVDVKLPMDPVGVREGGSISAAGRVRFDRDQDCSSMLVYLLVKAGTPYAREAIPDLEDIDTDRATVVQPSKSGRWECPCITGTVRSVAGEANQLVIWACLPGTSTAAVRDLQNFTAKPPAAPLAGDVTLGAFGTVTNPSGTGPGEPCPVYLDSTVRYIQAAGRVLGPANTPVWVAVFSGVPYPMVAPQTPTGSAVPTQTDINGDWSVRINNVASSPSTPFPVSQIVVWNWVASTSTYSVSAVIFHGKDA